MKVVLPVNKEEKIEKKKPAKSDTYREPIDL